MFDLSKIQNAAIELGIDLEINSANPGFHSTDENGNITTITFEELNNSLVSEFNLDVSEFNNKIHYNVSLHTNIKSINTPNYFSLKNNNNRVFTTVNKDTRSKGSESTKLYQNNLTMKYSTDIFESSAGSAA